jgi:hypothetical protein
VQTPTQTLTAPLLIAVNGGFGKPYRPPLPGQHVVIVGAGNSAELGALDPTGAPEQLRGLSCTHPGLGYVGLEWQRSLASASLRDVGRDADYVTSRLLRRTSDRTRCCAALRS